MSVSPTAAQSAISSWNHSPARGRPNIASRPHGTSAIQYMSALMIRLNRHLGEFGDPSVKNIRRFYKNQRFV